MDAVINLAGGLVLPYLVLSLFVMLIVEMLSRFLQMREKILYSAIKRMTADEDAGLTASFLAHPLIRSLASEGALPAYLPSRLFAKAFFDRFGRPTDQRDYEDPARPQLTNPDLSIILRTLNAGDSPDADVTSIQRWFSDVMDQASGIYRVRTLRMVALLATAIVLGTNFDAFQIANHAVHRSLIQKAYELEIAAAVKGGIEHPRTSAAADIADSDLAELERESHWIEVRAEQQIIFPIGWETHSGPRHRAFLSRSAACSQAY